jgi:hypothetical protein
MTTALLFLFAANISAGDHLPPILPWKEASEKLIVRDNDLWITLFGSRPRHQLSQHQLTPNASRRFGDGDDEALVRTAATKAAVYYVRIRLGSIRMAGIGDEHRGEIPSLAAGLTAAPS